MIFRHSPISSNCGCSGAFCVQDRPCVQPISRRISPHPRTLTRNQTAICSTKSVALMVPPEIHVITLNVIYRPRTDGTLSCIQHAIRA